MAATKETAKITEETMRLRRMLLNVVSPEMTKVEIEAELGNTLKMLAVVEKNTTSTNPHASKIQWYKDAPDSIFSTKEKAKAIAALEESVEKTVDFTAINLAVEKYGVEYKQNKNADGKSLPVRWYPLDSTLVTRGRKGLTRMGSTLDGYVQEEESIYQKFAGLDSVILVVTAALKKDKRYYQFVGKAWEKRNVVEFRKLRKAMEGSKLQYVRACKEVEALLP